MSRWGDPIWRLDPWAGKPVTLNFGDGPAKKYATAIDRANADLLRTVIGWWLYGPNGARGYRGLKTRFDQMRRLFVLCTQEGILASELCHFPRVADRLPEVLQASRSGEFLTLLHDLYERRDALGFTLLDRGGLARLAAAMPDHQKAQTPYIPPRIWHYQITRLRECLDDFWRIETKSRNASASVWMPIGTTLPISKHKPGLNPSIRFSGRRMEPRVSGPGIGTMAHSTTPRIALA